MCGLFERDAARWKLYHDGRLFDVPNDPREETALLRGKAPSAEAKAAMRKLKAPK